MKLSIILVSFASLTLSYGSIYAQDTKLNLQVSSSQLKDVFKNIESQSEFSFMYDNSMINVEREVTIRAKEKTIYQVLDQILDKNEVRYQIIDRHIVVIPREENQQERTITGKVTSDEDQSGLPGVNVIVKGTTQGTVTDISGNYSLSVPGENAVLVFSSVGFIQEEVSVGNKSIVDLVLTPDITSLDEIVVIGYGTVRKKDLTGSVASLKSDNFADGAPMAPEQIMQGKVAGVSIVQVSGSPGAASRVRIRGNSSVSAGNNPLYVIDGVPLQFGSANLKVNVGSTSSSPLSSEASNPLNFINPRDIESIDILKDASATAIYGSRGANGVIIITTKNQAGSGDVVTYDGYVGFSSVPEQLPFLNASEYRKYADDNGLPYSDEGADTYWQDEIFRTGVSQNHNLSFAGGSAKTNFRASFGYSNEEGVLLSSAFQKYTSRINGTHKAFNDKLTIGLTMAYAQLKDDKTPISSTIDNEGGNIMKDGLRWAPTLPVRNADGSYYQIGALRVNPVSWVDLTDETKSNIFLGNLNLSYDILESLKFSVDLGHSYEAVNRYTSVPDSHPAGANEGGRASISKFQNGTVLSEFNLTYDKQITANSRLTALLGYSFQRFETENTFTQANQFVSTSVTWNLMQSGTILSNTSFKQANRLSSYYGRLNYKLTNRYLFTFTLRRDGSSRFGGNNKWGTFPSGAIGWNISEEAFMNAKNVSNLKLRVGYGITGNQEIPNYLYEEQLGISGSAIYYLNGQAIPAVVPTNYANPNLQWEETAQLNIGLDFGFFNQRIYGSIDVYDKKTDNLLLSFSTAAPSVVSSQWANVGEVSNKGVEFALNAVVIKGNDFQWTTNINFTKNKNEVISLSNEEFAREEIRYGSGSGVVANKQNIKIIRPGLPLGTFYGKQFTGFDSDGLETYLDVDGIDGADEVPIGQIEPDIFYGFNNNFSFKNFDASINFNGTIGNDVYNNTEAEFSYPASAPGVNVLRSVLTTEASRQQNAEFSSRWIQNASFLRLDNLSVGYNFNVSNVSFIKNARVYVAGKNLLVITDYTGWDPEVSTRSAGIDYLSYPRPRVFMIGGTISF